MKWQFADLNTLRDRNSGYEIHLEGGTWFHPKKLRPKAPEGMDLSMRLTLLRKGLQHIKSIGLGYKENTPVKSQDHMRISAA